MKTQGSENAVRVNVHNPKPKKTASSRLNRTTRRYEIFYAVVAVVVVDVMDMVAVKDVFVAVVVVAIGVAVVVVVDAATSGH